MKRWACLLLGLYACMWCVRAQDKEKIKEAMTHYAYEEVIAATSKVDLLDEECLEWRLQAYKALHKWGDVEKLLVAQLERDTTAVKTWADLAECYRRIGNIRKSAECYGRAVELMPESSYLRCQHIQSLFDVDAWQQAKQACHDWLEKDSASAEAYRLLGQTYELMDSLEFAFLGYRAAYHLDSLDAKTVARVANLFNSNEQYQDALEVTETYRLTDTMDVDVNRQNAKAYCMLHRYPEAISRYEALKRMGDNSFLTYYYLGVAYYGDNWFYGTYDNMKEALKKSPATPANINALIYFARSAVRTSWKDEGITAMEQAVELVQPADSLMGKLYGLLAECYHYQGDWKKEAEGMVKQYEYTGNSALLYNIGIRYELLKNQKLAIRYLRKYMEAVPEPERYERDKQGNIMEDKITPYQDARRRIRKMEEEQFFRGKE